MAEHMLYGAQLDADRATSVLRHLFQNNLRSQERGLPATPICIWGTHGIGKALDDETPVLTPKGWTPIANLKVGDLVIDPDGGVATVEGVYPQGVKDAYEVTFGDGESVICCDEHLWHVYTAGDRSRGGPGQVLSLRQILEKGLKKSYKGGDLVQNRWFIPVMAPAEFGGVERTIGIDPYVLGALIGDGGLTGHGLRFSSKDPEILERLDASLPDDVVMKQVGDTCDWAIAGITRDSRNPNSLIRELDALGLRECHSYEKYIPEECLRWPVQDRIELLRGLMDTDGDVVKKPNFSNCTLNTSSPRLRDDVIELVRGLGGIATVYTKKAPTYPYKGEQRTGREAYRVNVRLPFNPFYLPRKAEHWKMPYLTRPIVQVESVEARSMTCIRVSSKRSLFVAGKGHVVTHNTMLVEEYARDRGWRFAYCAPAQFEEMGDLNGLPVLEQQDGRAVTRFAPPAWVPEGEGPGILLLDDINRADDRILRGLMQLLQKSELFSWRLPARWQIVCTANPEGGDYSVTPMDDAMLTRMLHISMVFDAKAWATWASRNDVDERGIAFVLTYPESVTGRRTTPRSLTQFFQQLDGISDLKASADLVYTLGMSSLDEVTVSTFMAFINDNLQQLVNPEDILDPPDFAGVSRKIEKLAEGGKRLDHLSTICTRLYLALTHKNYKPQPRHGENLVSFLLHESLPIDLRMSLHRDLVNNAPDAVKQMMRDRRLAMLILNQM